MTPQNARPAVIRIITYNIHGCRGRDRQWSPQRIADVIAPLKPDIVAMQEVDVGRMRSGSIDQAEMVAKALGMRSEFHPALQVMEERYGDAILTALPCRTIKSGPLPGVPGSRYFEPRGALWVEVDTPRGPLQVINTHLGLIARERRYQIDTLLGPEWLGHGRCNGPAVLLGDFNIRPGARNYRLLTETLRDAQAEGPRRGRPTFPSRFPTVRLDYAFVNDGITVEHAETVRTPLARLASDHLPVVFDLSLETDTRTTTARRKTAA